MTSSAQSTVSRPFTRWLLAPGLILGSFLLLISFWEWVSIGLIRAPATIAQYPFGSEEAMSDGGWYYQTAELYAQQMLINWISWLPTAWLFARALRHCTGKRMSWAYGLLILTLLTSATLNRMHNP